MLKCYTNTSKKTQTDHDSTKRTVAECLHLNHDTHIVTPQYRIHKNKTGRHTDRPQHSEQTNRRTNEYAVMRTHGHKHTVELKKVPLLAAGGGAGQWVYGIGRSGRVGCSVTTTVHWTHTHTHTSHATRPVRSYDAVCSRNVVMRSDTKCAKRSRWLMC